MTDDGKRQDDVKTKAELIEELISLRQPAGRITQAHDAERSLHSYKSMVTASRDLMVLVDSTYTYRAANPAYCDEHGWTQEKLLGSTVSDVLGKEAFETTLKPHMDRCLRGESVIFSFWWNSPRSGRRHVDVRYDPFFEDDGAVSGVMVGVRDTTDQTLTKEQLERSVAALEVVNRDLEAFSDSLAHDLKTPLLTVTNFSYYLQEALTGSLDQQQKDHLQRIRAAGQQMMHIIDDLRDLADVSRAEIRQENVDITSLARGIIDELGALDPDRSVTFDAEDGISASGDGRLLRLMLTNLLQNAWKYTALNGGPRIELFVTQDPGLAPVYHVRDNGIGFDNVHAERIFLAFERLETGKEFSGSGLGLATVERIVHRHGGRVWAEGQQGKGAVVHFTLASSAGDASGLIIERRSNAR